jgi:hypothetical protein
MSRFLDLKFQQSVNLALIIGASEARDLRPRGRKFLDLTGMKFGHWLVVAVHPERYRDGNSVYVLWDCVCRCGTKRAVRGKDLRNGKSTGCGGCSKRIDLVGQRFDRLKVLALHPERRRWGNSVTACWLCRYDCGVESVVAGSELRRGRTRSCGCLQRENQRKSVTTHGMSKTRIYRRWCGMLARCRNPNHPAYAYYGGRDDVPITVCEYYCDFVNWFADIGYQLDDNHLSQDRINNDRGYEPGNLCCADAATQLRNRRPYRRRTRAAP